MIYKHRWPYEYSLDVSSDPDIPLCDACIDERNRWLDYKLIHPLQIHTMNTTVQHVEQARRLRFEEWRDTINYQRAFIAKLCRQAEHWKTEQENDRGEAQ